MLDSQKTSGHDLLQQSLTHRESMNMSEQRNYQDFQAFLDQSPYAQGRKRGPQKSDASDDKTFNKDLDNYFNYFEVRKKEIKLPTTEEGQDELQDLNCEVSPIKIREIDESPIHNFLLESPNGVDMVKETVNPKMYGTQKTQGSDFGSPKGGDASMLDKNTKKLIETMQAKMIKMEQENRKLKKDVADLTSQNKKFQNQISSFITEQENFTKTRETYEKRIKKLQDYCRSTEDTMNTLKRILSLQEDELYEIISKKNAAQSSPQHRLSSMQDTKRMSKKTSIAREGEEASFLLSPNEKILKSNFLTPVLPALSKNSSMIMSESGSKGPKLSPQKSKV